MNRTETCALIHGLFVELLKLKIAEPKAGKAVELEAPASMN